MSGCEHDIQEAQIVEPLRGEEDKDWEVYKFGVVE